MTLVPPTPEQRKTMNLELYQDSEITKRDVKLLKEWLEKQPHLPQNMDGVRLERFLYGCKFSLERTKKMLDTYYTVRANIPEFFTNRDALLPEMQESFKHVSYFILPGLSKEGYRVTILKLNTGDIEKFDLQSLVKRIVMCLDARLLQEKCLNNIMVIDLWGYSMAHYAQCLPTLAIVRNAMLSIQDAFPLRLTRVHFLNVPVFIDKIISLFAPLLKEKLLHKFVFHTRGGECLQDYIPKEILPLEYGGEAPSIYDINDDWRQKLVSLRSWFFEEDRYSKADESKRPIKCHQPKDELLSGVPGSFRQLQID